MGAKEELINLNNADLDTLVTLPGIGPAMAERIIATRPFSLVEDLSEVSGIGQSAVERIKPLVFVTEIEEEELQEADPTSNIAEVIEQEGQEPDELEETDETEIMQSLTSQDQSESVILLPETAESAEMEATDDDLAEIDIPPAVATAVVADSEQLSTEDDDLIEPITTADEIESKQEGLKPEPAKASYAEVDLSGYVTQRQAFGIALTASVITFFFSVICFKYLNNFLLFSILSPLLTRFLIN